MNYYTCILLLFISLLNNNLIFDLKKKREQNQQSIVQPPTVLSAHPLASSLVFEITHYSQKLFSFSFSNIYHIFTQHKTICFFKGTILTNRSTTNANTKVNITAIKNRVRSIFPVVNGSFRSGKK